MSLIYIFLFKKVQNTLILGIIGYVENRIIMWKNLKFKKNLKIGKYLTNKINIKEKPINFLTYKDTKDKEKNKDYSECLCKENIWNLWNKRKEKC